MTTRAKAGQRTSRAGVDLIKTFEGFRPRAARLPDGRYVLGYGHTQTAREGVRIVEADAHSLLIYDLLTVEAAINEWVFTPLTQNQFDALVSFAFNIGLPAFRRSEVLRRINEGSLLQAAGGLEMWRQADLDGEPVVIDALVRRRAAEKALFLTPPEGFAPAPGVILKPQVDFSAYMAVPRHTPELVTVPLDGDEAVVERVSAAPAETLAPEPALEEAVLIEDEPIEDEPIDDEPIEDEPIDDEPIEDPIDDGEDPILELNVPLEAYEPMAEPLEAEPDLIEAQAVPDVEVLEAALEDFADTAPEEAPEEAYADAAAAEAPVEPETPVTAPEPAAEPEEAAFPFIPQAGVAVAPEDDEDEDWTAARAAAAAVSARLHQILSESAFNDEEDDQPALLSHAAPQPPAVGDTAVALPEVQPFPPASIDDETHTPYVRPFPAEAVADEFRDEPRPVDLGGFEPVPAPVDTQPTAPYLLLGLVGLLFIIAALVSVFRAPAEGAEAVDGAAAVSWVLGLLGIAGVSGALWLMLRREDIDTNGHD